MSALDAFNEQPCDILKGTDLSEDAYYTSTSFIPTMRLKEWKPVDRAMIKSDRQYCYIDMDNDSCDMYDKHAPFITNVFKDTSQDITRSMPTKKCVIEIDPSQVNNQELDKYWTSMGKAECNGVMLYLQQENANLQTKIEKVSHTIKDLEKTKTENTATTSKQNEVLGNLNRAIDETKDSIERTDVELVKKRQLYANLEENMSTSAASCKKTLGELRTSVGKCVTELKYWTGEYDNTTKSYATLNPIYQTQQVVYNTNKMALDNIISQYDNLVDKHDNLVLKYNSLHDNNVTCTDGLAACTTQYATCSNNDVVAVNNGTTTYGIWQQCITSAATCSNDNTRCQTENKRLTPLNTEAITSYQVCANQLVTCNDSLTKDKVTALGIKANIDEWLRTHVECNKYIPLIDAVKNSIQEIMIWCKLPMDLLVSNQKGLTDAQITAVQSIANQVAACEASVNAIPVIPPEPARPPAEAVAKDVEIFKDKDFQGDTLKLVIGRYGPDQLVGNDSISSMKVPTGKQATIYADTFNGDSKVLVGPLEITDLGSIGWDNRITAIIVTAT